MIFAVTSHLSKVRAKRFVFVFGLCGSHTDVHLLQIRIFVWLSPRCLFELVLSSVSLVSAVVVMAMV